MDTYQLESYLKQVREICSQNQNDPELSVQAVCHLIEEQLNAIQGDSSAEAFFNGEYHSQQGNYEEALKCYLEAKEIPNFQFFCYRASALISRERGQDEQALNYAQKALALAPQDLMIQELIRSLQLPAAPAHENFRHSEEAKSYESHQASDPNIAADNSIDPLEHRIIRFQSSQKEQLQSYLHQAKKQTRFENALYTLNGWSFSSRKEPLLLTEESRQSHGGHFLRWNGRGIVLNPGPNFLEHFHSQGLCVRDIDHVIITRPNNEAYGDVRAISELNLQINRIASDRHIIQYYLHQKAYQELASFLKPSFKQARNTIHKLEMFLDSPDVEKIELEENIILHYFQATLQENPYATGQQEHSANQTNLGIRLELSNKMKTLSLGYLSSICWSPLIPHHLGHCDILLTAFGNTNPNDYSMLGYNEDSLGFCGTVTLLQQLNPRLLLLTEFGGREGDIRLEITKKIRLDSKAQMPKNSSVVLPADIGLIVNLEALKIKCSLSQEFVSPNSLHVTTNSEGFGRLNYLSNQFCM